MSTGEEFARELLEAQPDRFGSVLADLPEEGRLGAMAFARRLAALVRATRATYVLHVASDLHAGAEDAAVAAYANLHVAGSFGHTGQLEVIVRHESLAAAINAQADRYALAERVRVHAGVAPTVVRALNGPYDLAVVGARWREYERMAEDLTRLIRVGGTMTVVNAGPLAAAPEGLKADALRRFLRSLAADERYLLTTGPDFAGVIAARIR